MTRRAQHIGISTGLDCTVRMWLCHQKRKSKIFYPRFKTYCDFFRKKSRGGGTPKSTPGTASSNKGGRKHRKRRRRNYDFSASKKSKSPKKRQRSRSTSIDSPSVGGSVSGKKRAKLDETVVQDDGTSRDVETPASAKPVKDEHEDEDEEPPTEYEPSPRIKHWKPKLEPDLPTENASGSSSFPATPASVYSNTTALAGVPSSAIHQDDSTSLNDMITRIYSRDEDDEEEDEEKSEKSDKRSTSNFASVGSAPAPTTHSTGIKTELELDQLVTATKVEENVQDIEMKRPYIPEGPPPWDQPELRAPDPATRGWSLICSSLEDWQTLADSFGEKPKGKGEADLVEVLRRDFLPAMQDLFDQKEKERLGKLAELAPRRTSDRLEVKRLQKEREVRVFCQLAVGLHSGWSY